MKTKQEFRDALDLLRELPLDVEQSEALDTVERFPGELRRQIAELRRELVHAQQNLLAGEKLSGELQKSQQARLHLEEHIRSLEDHARVTKARLLSLEQRAPRAIPFTPDVVAAALLLSKQTSPIYHQAFAEWDARQAHQVLLQYAILLTLKSCQMMIGQPDTDAELEKELLMACQRYFDRMASGFFTWTRQEIQESPLQTKDASLETLSDR